MLGLMMDRALNIAGLLEHAEKFHHDSEIVSRDPAGFIHRQDYATTAIRIRKLANALKAMGVEKGSRVATIAWNTHRHLELYYAISCLGAICHTINPRLHPQQIGYILNHAEDMAVFFDITFAPLAVPLSKIPEQNRQWVVMTDQAHKPEILPENCQTYEELITPQSDQIIWPELDENTACALCYTSGTTGNPKGVLYSQRSTILHALVAVQPDCFGLSVRDSVLPVVPMFHVNAWSVPYAAFVVGAKLVMPGAGLDGASLYELFDAEKVTLSLGVPTVWLGLLNYLREKNLKLDHLTRTVIGGAAVPESMIAAFEDEHDVQVIHAWGMTEMSPLGVANTLKAKHLALPLEQRRALSLKQGRGFFGVELRLVSETGEILPWDGQAAGHLQVRGPWIAKGYFKGEGGDVLTADGWFDTGDVATIDPDGFMRITDRSKDVIKSGGEWISSIDLENAAMGHPSVLQAAVIGVPDEKWTERPLLIVVARPGHTIDKSSVLDYLSTKVAKWWVPERVEVADSLPIGATGKVLKTELRKMYL